MEPCVISSGVLSPSSFLLPFLLLLSPSKAVNNRTGILSIWLEEIVPGDCHSSPRPPTPSSSAGTELGCGAAALHQLRDYLAHHFLRKVDGPCARLLFRSHSVVRLTVTNLVSVLGTNAFFLPFIRALRC